jgi:hypothetical protein
VGGTVTIPIKLELQAKLFSREKKKLRQHKPPSIFRFDTPFEYLPWVLEKPQPSARFNYSTV